MGDYQKGAGRGRRGPLSDRDRAAWEPEPHPGPSREGSAGIRATESEGHPLGQAGEGAKAARAERGRPCATLPADCRPAPGSVKSPEPSDLEFHPLCPKPRALLGPGGDQASGAARNAPPATS